MSGKCTAKNKHSIDTKSKEETKTGQDDLNLKAKELKVILQDMTNIVKDSLCKQEERKVCLLKEKHELENEILEKKQQLHLTQNCIEVEQLTKKIADAKETLKSQETHMMTLDKNLQDGIKTIDGLRECSNNLSDRINNVEHEIDQATAELEMRVTKNAKLESTLTERNATRSYLSLLQGLGHLKVIKDDGSNIELAVESDGISEPLNLSLRMENGIVVDVIAKIAGQNFDYDKVKMKTLISQRDIQKLVLYLKDAYIKQSGFIKEIKCLRERFPIDWVGDESIMTAIIDCGTRGLNMCKIKVDTVNNQTYVALLHAEGPMANVFKEHWMEYSSLTQCIEHLHQLGSSQHESN